jgi:hypothetical protein
MASKLYVLLLLVIVSCHQLLIIRVSTQFKTEKKTHEYYVYAASSCIVKNKTSLLYFWIHIERSFAYLESHPSNYNRRIGYFNVSAFMINIFVLERNNTNHTHTYRNQATLARRKILDDYARKKPHRLTFSELKC